MEILRDLTISGPRWIWHIFRYNCLKRFLFSVPVKGKVFNVIISITYLYYIVYLHNRSPPRVAIHSRLRRDPSEPQKMICWKVPHQKITQKVLLCCLSFPLATIHFYINLPVSCITSFLSYCAVNVLSKIRLSSNTVSPRLALQSKWPKASANIEERKDVCAFRFRINRNHLPFLNIPSTFREFQFCTAYMLIVGVSCLDGRWATPSPRWAV